MKSLLLASLMVYSSVSMAGYSCFEKDSTLLIEPSVKTDVKVTLFPKEMSRVPKFKTFVGKKLPLTSQTYHKVERYELSGLSGKGELSVTTIPVLARIPSCRGRVCHDEGSYSQDEITAELDIMGKITSYACEKI